MRILSFVAATTTLLLLGSCTVVPKAEPPPHVAPVPVATRPAPAPVAPPPASSDWRDWPATRGDWRYSDTGSGSSATFGTAGAPMLIVQCTGDRRIRLNRVTSGAGAMTVRASTTSRVLATDGNGVATLSATDPLLDAMGYSRGRFVIEMAVQPTIVVPAWAEFLRVIEDCRQ